MKLTNNYNATLRSKIVKTENKNMKICFELSMPNRASWNGRWSGKGTLYAKVVNFSNSKAGNAAANKILEHKSYYYRWDDGWGASISVRKVDGKESASIKRRSKGFCGYDWMIDNIRSHGNCYDKKPEPCATQTLAPAL